MLLLENKLERRKYRHRLDREMSWAFRELIAWSDEACIFYRIRRDHLSPKEIEKEYYKNSIPLLEQGYFMSDVAKSLDGPLKNFDQEMENIQRAVDNKFKEINQQYLKIQGQKIQGQAVIQVTKHTSKTTIRKTVGKK